MAENNKDNYGYTEDEIWTLEFDDGEEEENGIVGVFDLDGKDYIALNPLGTAEVYIYHYREENDDEYVDFITDRDEYKKAMAEFERLMAEAEEEDAGDADAGKE